MWVQNSFSQKFIILSYLRPGHPFLPANIRSNNYICWIGKQISDRTFIIDIIEVASNKTFRLCSANRFYLKSHDFGKLIPVIEMIFQMFLNLLIKKSFNIKSIRKLSQGRLINSLRNQTISKQIDLRNGADYF